MVEELSSGSMTVLTALVILLDFLFRENMKFLPDYRWAGRGTDTVEWVLSACIV